MSQTTDSCGKKPWSKSDLLSGRSWGRAFVKNREALLEPTFMPKTMKNLGSPGVVSSYEAAVKVLNK
jgi:hypothetical protein